MNMHAADAWIDWLAGHERTSDAFCQRTNTSFGHKVMDSNTVNAYETPKANDLYEYVDDTDDGFRFVF